jgi:hypothetical protein
VTFAANQAGAHAGAAPRRDMRIKSGKNNHKMRLLYAFYAHIAFGFAASSRVTRWAATYPARAG